MQERDDVNKRDGFSFGEVPLALPGKFVEKLLKKKRKLRELLVISSDFRAFGINLGSVRDVANRALTARTIARRALQRKQR